jgi:hypothetical protein
MEKDGPYDGPQGYQYGVQQNDTTIIADFKGPGQYEQAKRYLEQARHHGTYADYRLVRRSPTSRWTSFSARELDYVLARSAPFYQVFNTTANANTFHINQP